MIERDGYSVSRAVFSEAECKSLLSELCDGVDISRAGVRNLMGHDVAVVIANDERLMGLAQELTGTVLIPFKVTLFNKTGKANWLVAWHQDTALPIVNDQSVDGWGPSSVKSGLTFSHAPSEVLNQILALRLHLDASTPKNGPLRVIPGSHYHRISDDSEFRKVVETGPHLELTVGRGGVITMRPMLVHASSKCLNDDPRRVLHIEYAPRLQITKTVRLAFA